MIMYPPKCEVAILAGGQGTRLRERSGDLPKPMVPVCGKPVLQYQIELCQKYGYSNIAILVQHRHEKISEYFSDGSLFGVTLTYVIENQPRGTSGALHDALPLLADRFFVLYGDTFVDVDLRKMWIAHIESGADGTLLLHPNDHPQDSDLVGINHQNIVEAIFPYPHPQGQEARNLVNAGLYVLEQAGVKEVAPIAGKADIAKNMFPHMLSLGKVLHAYITPEYIKDMGTPERLDKVERDFIAGLPEKLSTRNLRAAVFLDRDGTLIRDVNHLTQPDQVDFLPEVPAAIRRLNFSGMLSVVITNQPVLARGEITFEGLARVHARFESLLGNEGAYINGLYFCPHHPDGGFLGEVFELKRQCICRKPEPGLIDQACRDLNIDRRNSWMIGDATSDIEAALRAGIRSILLRTGYAGSDLKYATKPDYVCYSLSDAVEWVLAGHADLSRKMMQIALTVSGDTRLVLMGGLARAGKSFAAQVLKELLHPLGRKAHVISLDGWLKPKNQRFEGVGVCERYDLTTASSAIQTLYGSGGREVLLEPLYDRILGAVSTLVVEHSVGPEDLLIVEGVPALLMDELNALQRVVKVYVDIAAETRSQRLINEYTWRGHSDEQCKNILYMRRKDETPVVEQSRNYADFVIENDAKD